MTSQMASLSFFFCNSIREVVLVWRRVLFVLKRERMENCKFWLFLWL